MCTGWPTTTVFASVSTAARNDQIVRLIAFGRHFPYVISKPRNRLARVRHGFCFVGMAAHVKLRLKTMVKLFSSGIDVAAQTLRACGCLYRRKFGFERRYGVVQPRPLGPCR